MADEVAFENFEGLQHALYEDFPLGKGSEDEKVKCLVIQNEDGRPPIRVKAKSPEADALRKRYPVLKQLDSKSAAADEGAGESAPAAKPRKAAPKRKRAAKPAAAKAVA